MLLNIISTFFPNKAAYWVHNCMLVDKYVVQLFYVNHIKTWTITFWKTLKFKSDLAITSIFAFHWSIETLIRVPEFRHIFKVVTNYTFQQVLKGNVALRVGELKLNQMVKTSLGAWPGLVKPPRHNRRGNFRVENRTKCSD